ncbi:hypothetical protein [Pseudoalteromonas sp. PAR1]|jgi:hypothetical protein|uniref:hypothetical protein n=1 Tax=unclassified Pseudoalteromonas TaxID=194690 RepID=UPI00248B78AE|nr:hypothetical protein [Pseudoalteromonas sp. PAR1]
MSKSENTLIRLEAALQRILAKEPKRISKHKKLSIRAVEEEANLGNGTCYYYEKFTSDLRKLISNHKSSNIEEKETKYINDGLKFKAANEKRLKEKYRDENTKLKHTIQQLAAEHHQFNDLIRQQAEQLKQSRSDNEKLEVELKTVKEKLIYLNRENIIQLNKSNKT